MCAPRSQRHPKLASQRGVSNAECIHCHIKILALLDATVDGLNVRKNFFDGLTFLCRPVKITTAQSVLNYELYVWLGRCSPRLIFSSAKLPEVSVGSGFVSKNSHFNSEISGGRDPHHLLGRRP